MSSKPAARSHKPAPWTEVATLLVDVATGRAPADLVVRNGRWVNVHSGEVIAAPTLRLSPDASPIAALMPHTPSARAQGRRRRRPLHRAGPLRRRICMSKAAW